MNKLPEGWKEVELGDVLDYEQPTEYIVNSVDYDDSYKTPVLTAGKSFILGHTNETEGIYTKLPVIIFDDFTTDTKYVDFKFKVKSSAMKMLTAKDKSIDLRFIFLLMQTIKRDATTHKRYYISLYSKIKIPLPPFSIQKKIVAKIEKSEKTKLKRQEADKLTKDYLHSVFHDMFETKYERIKLGDEKLFTVQSGGTPSTAKKEYWENGDIPWIGSTVCKDLPVYKAEKFITRKGLENSSTKIFPKNTVIVALVGATIGKTGKLMFDCATNQNIAGITIKDTAKVDSDYLFYASKLLYTKFTSLSHDAFKMATLSFIKNLDVPLPPLTLQQKFAREVEKVEKIKEKQKQSKEHIDGLFNALMQKAFRGELV